MDLVVGMVLSLAVTGSWRSAILWPLGQHKFDPCILLSVERSSESV
jgi:hypothetical protein